MWEQQKRSISSLLCFCAYVSCQCKTHAHFNSNIQKACRAAALFFENGEMAVTLPTAALSGCGFGSLKRETEKSTSRYLVWVSGNDNDLGHLSWRGHLPTVETHLCFFKAGRRENVWVGKEKKSLQRGGNKWQHPKGCNLLKAYVPWQCMSLVLLCHLTSWSRKNTWG